MLEIKKTLNIVEDATPQLGGDLDVNSHAIVSADNGDIEITTNGIGSLKISAAGMTVTGKSTGNLQMVLNADSTRAVSLVINHGAAELGTIQFWSGAAQTFMIVDGALATGTLSFIPYIDNVAQTALTTTIDYNTGKWDFPTDVEIGNDLEIGDDLIVRDDCIVIGDLVVDGDCDVVGDLTAGTVKADNGYTGIIPGPEAGKKMYFTKGVLTDYRSDA